MELLTSAEAVTLAGTKVDPAALREQQAAADVAAQVLRAVADGYVAGADLLYTSARLAEPVPALR